MALVIFILHIMELTDINKKNEENSSKVAVLIHWCMIWAFGFHGFRFIIEVVELIIWKSWWIILELNIQYSLKKMMVTGISEIIKLVNILILTITSF